MARHLNPCASETVVSLPPPTLKNGASFLPKSAVLSSRIHCSKWVSQILSRFYVTSNFQLKCSNGHPLTTVCLRDGHRHLDLPGPSRARSVFRSGGVVAFSNAVQDQSEAEGGGRFIYHPGIGMLKTMHTGNKCHSFMKRTFWFGRGQNASVVRTTQVSDVPEGPVVTKDAEPEVGHQFFYFSEPTEEETTLSITVVGASGDLARKKIFPALFALFYEGYLPENFTVFGYARTKMNDEELQNMISQTLTCRIDKRENCDDKMKEFLQRCFYHSGQYNSENDFAELDLKLREKEGGRVPNRLFYLSIPPNIFVDVVRCASRRASSEKGWTRVIVEKPFGRDSESSRELTRSLKQYLAEDQIFRIDHYLGKELVENLSVLRFSNLVFEPLWSRNYIQNVQFIFSEDIGTEGRGGYFDHYGIIRDIMQNHLLQILALFAMETPVSLDAEDIRNEKVKVLRSVRPFQLEDIVVGQYKGHSKGGKSYPGYTDDPTVPKNSLTPTFAAAALFIDNARWDGVPFLMKTGKALYTKRAEIRVQFRHVPGNLFRGNIGYDLDRTTNELVIRVQPDEAIFLKINNKVPGLGMRLDRSDLNLLYKARYPIEIPDAYERLLLDAIEGERRLFIRSDELDAAWALFTPLLKELEENKIAPELYPYGSRGPVGAHYLAAKHGVRWGDLIDEYL